MFETDTIQVKKPGDVDSIPDSMAEKPGTEISMYLNSVLGDDIEKRLYWVKTRERSDLASLPDYFSGLGNRHRINDIKQINKFLERANSILSDDQYLVINLETKRSRARRIIKKYPKPISIPYYGLDFILKRVFPKLGLTKKLYFKLTNGRNRVILLTEGLARLVSCGFEVVDFKTIGYRTHIIARKVKEPVYDMNASYGLLIKLRRVGKDGQLFNVYKIRTMHPYSEYLQDYIYEMNDLDEGGKIKNDIRMTKWGMFFRKYWIDELPMFINYFKREMKLVGVRPLSQHYFNLYPEDLRELRTKIKPGLVPPYYADMPNGLDEIQESERRYLKAYMEKPIRTDIRYFFKVFYNIIFKGARSK